MTATPIVRTASTTSRRTRILAVGTGVVVAIAACAIDAYSAHAVGVSSSFAALRPAIFAPFVLIGVVAAYLGWGIIRRRTSRPGLADAALA